MPILAVNTTAAKEHVPEVERKIRLIKGILNTLPFKRMPRLMLIELVYHVVLWLKIWCKPGWAKNIVKVTFETFFTMSNFDKYLR